MLIPGLGKADILRSQGYVKVTGHIQDYRCQASHLRYISCSCILAPRTPVSSPKFWCKPDCPIVIERREFVNCTELQVISDLIDVSAHGVNVVDISSGRRKVFDDGIEVLESTRTLADEQNWAGTSSYEEARWYMDMDGTLVAPRLEASGPRQTDDESKQSLGTSNWGGWGISETGDEENRKGSAWSASPGIAPGSGWGESPSP